MIKTSTVLCSCQRVAGVVRGNRFILPEFILEQLSRRLRLVRADGNARYSVGYKFCTREAALAANRGGTAVFRPLHVLCRGVFIYIFVSV